jgi:hypothetical protein
MADFVIKKGNEQHPVYGITLTPDDYAAQLKPHGFSIVSVDGKPYAAQTPGMSPQDTYRGKSLEVLDPDTGRWTSMSSVSDIEQALLKSRSAVRMPDGTVARNTGDNSGGVQAAPGVGLLINGLPINTALNPESQTSEQTAALRDLNIPAGGWATGYAGSQTPWGGDTEFDRVTQAMGREGADGGPPGEIPDSFEGKFLTVFNPETGTEEEMSSVKQIEKILKAVDEEGQPASYVKMPDGTIAQLGTSQDDITGTARYGRIWETPRGGLLINGLPINVVLDPSSITSEQAAYLKELGVPEGGYGPHDPNFDYTPPWLKKGGNGGNGDDRPKWPVDFPTFETPAIGGVTLPDPERAKDITLPDPERAGDITLPDPERLGGVTLPESERVGPRFGQDFDQWYSNVIDAQAGNLGRYYDFPTPLSPAAQMDIYGTGAGIGAFGAQRPMVRGPQNLTLINTQTGAQEIVPLDDTPQTSALINDLMQQGFVSQGVSDSAPVEVQGYGGIPQPTAQTPQQFEALQFLLSGQGFDPATMARMRAGATDAAAMAGRSQAGTARLMGEQAGLAGSPAAMALEAGARRQQGDATTRALNQIEIQNAMQGMQNRVTGAGMELDRQTSGAAMANQMALSNASNILSGMQQNVANVQQTHMTNIGNVVGQGMTQAGQQAGLYGQGAMGYNQAAMGLAGQAPFFNAAQAAAAGLSQAELDRQRDLFNAEQASATGLNQAQLDRQRALFNAAQSERWGLNQAQLTRQGDLFNATQAGTWDWNQAQLDRQRQMFNAGNVMTRYGWDMGNLVNLANQTGAQNYYNLGNYGLQGLSQQGTPWAGLNFFGNQSPG